MASTKHLHLPPIAAVAFAPSHVRSLSLSSCGTVSAKVFFYCLTSFLEFWGFHSSTINVIWSTATFSIASVLVPPMWDSRNLHYCWRSAECSTNDSSPFLKEYLKFFRNGIRNKPSFVTIYWVRHLTYFIQIVLISWMATLNSCLIWQIISFILPLN